MQDHRQGNGNLTLQRWKTVGWYLPYRGVHILLTHVKLMMYMRPISPLFVVPVSSGLRKYSKRVGTFVGMIGSGRYAVSMVRVIALIAFWLVWVCPWCQRSHPPRLSVSTPSREPVAHRASPPSLLGTTTTQTPTLPVCTALNLHPA